jgi:hypothetical protein
MSSVDEKPSTNIPIIDFLTWTSPSKVSSEGRLQTARELVQACHSYGFVYIKNHGIAPELVKQAFEMSQKFFDLPIKKRKLVANANTGAFRGYIWPGMMDVGAISDEGRKGQDREGKVVDLNVSGWNAGITGLESLLIGSRRAMTWVRILTWTKSMFGRLQT